MERMYEELVRQTIAGNKRANVAVKVNKSTGQIYSACIVTYNKATNKLGGEILTFDTESWSERVAIVQKLFRKADKLNKKH